MQTIQALLNEYKEEDYSVKIVSAIFNTVPVDVHFQYYNRFEEGLKRVKPNITTEEIEKAYKLANSENVQSVLKLFSLLDTSDKLIAGYASIKNILNFFDGSQKRTFESDPQQALDAGVKGFSIGYAIHKLYNGSIQEKISKFKNTPAGIEILVFYSLMEVALPFTDNLIEGSINVLSKLFGNRQEIQNKFSQLGVGSFQDANESITALKDTLPNYLDRTKTYVEPIINKIKAFLPTGLNVADSATGAMATGVDFLPIWTFLGARLVNESIAWEISI
ncbi:MAG: hypothetical protein ACK4UJ_02470 [Leptonema sp. (in: bacteria)]